MKQVNPMHRRAFIAGISAVVLLPSMGSAADFKDQVLQRLRGDGYGNFHVEQTWLGRVRITAVKGNSEREVVLNPRTGEILRDAVRTSQGSANRSQTDSHKGGSDHDSTSDTGTSGSSDTSGHGGDDGGSDDGGGDDGGSDDGGSDDHGGGDGGSDVHDGSDDKGGDDD